MARNKSRFIASQSAYDFSIDFDCVPQVLQPNVFVAAVLVVIVIGDWQR
jgi:hypothetical protein